MTDRKIICNYFKTFLQEEKILKIPWFQLRSCEDFLLFFVNKKLNMFRIWKCWLGKTSNLMTSPWALGDFDKHFFLTFMKFNE